MTLTRHPLSRSQRGFSLIELAVVVAIIGILAAIAIPTFLGQRAGAQDAQAKSALRNVAAEARALAAQQDAAGFPEELLAEMAGLEGMAAFPSGLLTELPLIEPSFTYADGNTASEGPNNISVGMPLEVAAGGPPDLTKVAFAALSESGTCWFLTDDLDRGIRYAKDSSEGAADLCYAGRIKLADTQEDFNDEPWTDDDPDAPIWFPTIDDPAWPDPSAPDIGAAPEEEPGGGEEPPGGNACLPNWETGFEGIASIMEGWNAADLIDDMSTNNMYTDNPGNWITHLIDPPTGNDSAFSVATANPRSGAQHLRAELDFDAPWQNGVELYPTWGCAPQDPDWIAEPVLWDDPLPPAVPLSAELEVGQTLTFTAYVAMDVQFTGVGDVAGSFHATPLVFPVNDVKNAMVAGVDYDLQFSDNPDSANHPANVDSPHQLQFFPWQGNPADGTYHKIEWTIGGHETPVYVSIRLDAASVNQIEGADANLVIIDVDDVAITIDG